MRSTHSCVANTTNQYDRVGIGEYRGKTITDEEAEAEAKRGNEYMFHVKLMHRLEGHIKPFTIDGQDASHSSWCRLINAADYTEEQNAE